MSGGAVPKGRIWAATRSTVGEMQQLNILDRGLYIEVSLGVREFGEASFIDVLAAASNRFGAKPILLVCDDPAEAIDMTHAYNVGVELSARLPFRRIAIALRGRKSSSADRFTEVVAENRGAAVRYFESVHLARMWLSQGQETRRSLHGGHSR